MTFHHKPVENGPDIVLIGAGIMSATLGTFLKELDPSLTIDIYERLDVVAGESSDAWNNAGTGHSAFCELNYAPQKEDGTVDISKALHITESFEVSRQFWSYLIQQHYISDPHRFINSIPHISFVWDADNVTYLRKRYEAMKAHHFYSSMQYSEDPAILSEWMPLVMKDRDSTQKVAASKIDIGTDVNFGELTRILFDHLTKQPGVTMHLSNEVRDLKRDENGDWLIHVKNIKMDVKRSLRCKFVFIGAGGGALPLLEKSDIPEGKGYGGFPVSGQWLRCNNKNVIQQHHAKVYGKASVGTPPMSVPHLDSRLINGERELLFGPYAGFSTRFLKKGSYWDLPMSIKASNIYPMVAAGLHNIPLTKYLIDQVRQSSDDRLQALKDYFPDADISDWELKIAGQRVQVIKRDYDQGGILEFGTEVVSSKDGSLAALLGASPGASTSVSIMLGLIEKCFPGKVKSETWQAKLKKMIPSYGLSLADDAELCAATRQWTSEVLQLKN